MSNQDGFSGGFLAGAIFGSLVGGVLGTVLTSRLAQSTTLDDPKPIRSRTNRRDRSVQMHGEDEMEAARQVLEAKIAQLNAAIDEVRHQLHDVNGSVSEIDRSLPLRDDN